MNEKAKVMKLKFDAALGSRREPEQGRSLGHSKRLSLGCWTVWRAYREIENLLREIILALEVERSTVLGRAHSGTHHAAYC
jgi:hypothetical protein